MRLDQLLVNKGLAASRTQSQKLIRAGYVYLRVADLWQLIDKPSSDIAPDTELKVELGNEQTYVSRAGIKLAAALDHLQLSVEGKIALDVGQSTGGFSDCLLARGIARVIGIDVGSGQLASSLRTNKRLTCIEGINARYLTPQDLARYHFPPVFDLIVMDVSFISQTLILPRLPELLAEDGDLVSLVKPQFEVGPEGIGKGGIVKDTSRYQAVEHKISHTLEALGLARRDYFDSPITGGDGNREFFLHATKKR